MSIQCWLSKHPHPLAGKRSSEAEEESESEANDTKDLEFKKGAPPHTYT